MKIGRFAPSPTGRMHLGNLFAAVMSWLDARKGGGQWLLRHEDIDPQRSRPEYARQIEEDLAWLGLHPDGEPQYQSRRGKLYEASFERLRATGLTYPCFCRRADLLAVGAPHLSDGRVLYSGRCRPDGLPRVLTEPMERHSTRLLVPDRVIEFTDGLYGPQRVNLAAEVGDFVIRRADGAWAYQLAVVADDADMGVTDVVRGSDLLQSAAQQLYLYDLLGLAAPRFMHIPLLCRADGRRLSKRDESLAADALRERYSAEELLGQIGKLAGRNPTGAPMTLAALLEAYDPARIPRELTLQVRDA